MTTTGLTIEQVQKAVDAILEVLGEPSTDAQKNAIANFSLISKKVTMIKYVALLPPA